MTAFSSIQYGGGRTGLSAYEIYADIETSAGRVPLSPTAWVGGLKGNVGLVFDTENATWVTDYLFAQRSAVLHVGSLYVALVDSIGTEPGTDGSVWRLIAPGIDLTLYDTLLASVAGLEASAETSAATASSAAAAADISRLQASALLTGVIYPSAAGGLANTGDGEYFVVAGDGTTTYARLFLNDGGVADSVSDYFSSQALADLDQRELAARTSAALEIFESTANTTISVTPLQNNGVTVSWDELSIRITSIGAIAALAPTELAPGNALVIDLTGSSPYNATVQVASTFLYAEAIAGTKAILLQQSTNRFIGALEAHVRRAIDYSRIDQVDNTSDDAKPLSADALTALNALSWKHLDATGGLGITTAKKNGNGLDLGWPVQKFGSPLGEISVAARTAAYLAPNKLLYVDPAEDPVVDPEENPDGAFTLVEATSSAVLSALHAVGGIVIVVQTDEGRVGGLMGAAINRKIDRDDVEAARSAAHLTTMQPEGIVAEQQWLATASWNRNLAFKEINVGTSWFQYQPEGREGSVAITNTNTKLDLEYLPSGATVTVWSKGGGSKVVFHDVPLGQTGNRATLADGDVIRVMQMGTRDDPEFLVAILNGTPTWDNFSRPAMDQSIVLAGQSNWSIAAVSGGIGGFVDRLYQRYGTSYPSTYFIEGATGGSSITGSAGFWNGVLPGTAGQTYIDAIDAAVAAGQPVPTETCWRLGEQDIAALAAGTMTTADFKAYVQDFFEYVRSYNGGVYSAMEFIVSGPQAQDDDTEFGGAMAARTAYIELAEELSYVYGDGGWYDVPRQFGNVHPFNAGYHAMGHRSATAWLRSLHVSEVRDLGPYINAVTLAADGLSVELDIRCETDTIVIPNGRRGPKADLGPYPFEFCAINGDPRTDAPIVLTGGTIARVSDTQVTVTLTCDEDLTGARIYTYNGKSPNARRGQFLRNNNVHGPSLGYPMRDQRTAILA